ncbi:hypothetical protein, partial [Mycobacteroides abscessus]|uniref:hypothetical protein n=1 Tax=Mycobacteroides abscessus TaxID=36809 RepID=UPI003CED588B
CRKPLLHECNVRRQQSRDALLRNFAPLHYTLLLKAKRIWMVIKQGVDQHGVGPVILAIQIIEARVG